MNLSVSRYLVNLTILTEMRGKLENIYIFSVMLFSAVKNGSRAKLGISILHKIMGAIINERIIKIIINIFRLFQI